MSTSALICNSVHDPDKWLAARTTGIGASDLPAIMGLSKYRGPLHVYRDKTIPPKEDGTKALRLRIGHLLEDDNLELYIEATGRYGALSGDLYRSGEYPWLLATLDGWTIDRSLADGPVTPDQLWPWEAKSTSERLEERWSEGVPDDVLVQAHGQMIVTGRDRSTVSVMIGNYKHAWKDVPRDEAIVREVVRASRAMWRRIEAKDPPSADATCFDLLKEMYPQDDGTTVQLTEADLSLVERWRALKADEKGLRGQLDAVRTGLAAIMGSATRGLLPGGGAITYKTQTRAEYICKATSFRVLRETEAS